MSLTVLRAMRVYAPVYYPVDHAVHPPSFPGLSIEYRRHANGSFTLGRLRRKRSRNIRDAQTRTGRIPNDGSVKEGSPRYGRLPVRTATGRVLFLRFLRLSDGGEREVGRSVGPSVRLGSWRTSDLSSDSAEEASPVLRVSSFSATLSSTLATLSLSPQPSSPVRPPPPLPLSPCRRLPVLLFLHHLRRYTSCSSALFCLLFMSLPIPLPLSATLPPPRRRRRRLLLRLLLAFPTCGVDLVASPPPRRPGSAVHQWSAAVSPPRCESCTRQLSRPLASLLLGFCPICLSLGRLCSLVGGGRRRRPFENESRTHR